MNSSSLTDQVRRLQKASPANRAFYLRTTLVAFESSDQCTPETIARGAAVTAGTFPRFDFSKLFSKRELTMHRRIAKQVSGGSIAQLIAASCQWQLESSQPAAA